MRAFILMICLFCLAACQQNGSEGTGPNNQQTTTDLPEQLPKGCDQDQKACPNGDTVGRDINNQCAFFACDENNPKTEYQTVKGCTNDIEQCPDGSEVSRNPSDGCNFFACPATSDHDASQQQPAVTACTKELKVCKNGRRVGRNANNNCEYEPCEPVKKGRGEPLMCTQDVKSCPDGSYVGRDSYKRCAFKPCPEDNNLQ